MARVRPSIQWPAFGLLVLVAICFTTPLRAADPTPAELLKVLKTRDAQLENAKLEYTMSGEQKVEADDWRFQNPAPAQPKNARPAALKYLYDETLIIRGKECTFVRTINPKAPKPNPGDAVRLAQFKVHKWNNAKGVSHELFETDKLEDSYLSFHRGGYPVDMAEEQALWVKFAFGIGFGKALKQIDRLEKDGTGWVVEGSIQIWWKDVSHCRLHLDDRFIVRQAHIETDVEGNRTALDSSCTGLVRVNSFVSGKTGSFKRTSLGRKVEGKPPARPNVVTEFNVDFDRITFNLDEKSYESLIEMVPKRGTPVIDYIREKRYKFGEDAKPQSF